MIRFVEAWPNQARVTALGQHLGWSHFKEILYSDNELARQFYAEMCRLEHWSVRTLRDRVRSMMFERTAGLPRPLSFRFSWLERYVQRARSRSGDLARVGKVPFELGTDFAFIARQKRMTIGSQDFYLDLLFYHRRLDRLVAIDLKHGRFEAAYKGQMELYLRWLDQHERRANHEEAPSD